MHSSDSEHSDDNAGSSGDPHPSNAASKSWKEIENLYSSGSESRVPATPEKEFEEPDGQSDCSDLHTPAQASKRRRLPSLSPVERRQSIAPGSDSDGWDRDSLFESTPTSQRGFKRPLQPWSLVKVWPLDKYDKEVTYEEIKTILTQSLDDSGSKTYIKSNSNLIARWRPKQVSSSFFATCLIDTN
jgi:hypothetical protein